MPIPLVALSFALWAGQSQPAATRPASPPYGLADALVDAARHHGHLYARDDPRRTTLHVLAMMKAATEYDPRHAEAWMWQFDLLSRLGSREEAREALARYVALAPDDDSAALQLLAMQVETLQTAEARGAFLAERLKDPPRSRFLRSDIHRRLAEFYREREQRDLAMQQIASALRWMPLNVAARELAYDLFSDTDPFQQRVELALQLLTANPSQVDVLWELGRLLDEHAMHREAQAWYVYALSIQRGTKNNPPDVTHWLTLARSYADCGDYTHALEAIDQALTPQPRHVAARLLKASILQRREAAPATAPANADDRSAQVAPSRAILDELAFEYNQRMQDVLKNKDAAAATDIAWFFAFWLPDDAKALQMSELAMTAPSPDAAARRAYGFALLLNYRTKDAIAQLQPLAEADPWAAYGLGQALVAENRRAEAAEALKRGATLRYSGMAYERIAELLRSLGESPPPPPKYPQVSAALDRFDRRVLNFFTRPQDTLRLTARFLDDPIPVGGPCRVRLRLENVNPPGSFSVTLGAGLMVQPRVMLSATLGGPAGKSFRNFTEALLNARPVLAPGESIERVVSVDVGALREELITRATATQSLTLTALLNPQRRYDDYVAGLGSVYAPPVTATRPGLPTDDTGIAELVRSAADADPRRRAAAARALGAMLAARDRALGAFEPAEAIDRGGVTEALLTLAIDREAAVRAMALDALRWSRPSGRLVAERLSRLVGDESFVVRLMAIRLFAQIQWDSFSAALPDIARNDPSASVRLLAKSYLAPVAAPASQPASSQP